MSEEYTIAYYQQIYISVGISAVSLPSFEHQLIYLIHRVTPSASYCFICRYLCRSFAEYRAIRRRNTFHHLDTIQITEDQLIWNMTFKFVRDIFAFYYPVQYGHMEIILKPTLVTCDIPLYSVRHAEIHYSIFFDICVCR